MYHPHYQEARILLLHLKNWWSKAKPKQLKHPTISSDQNREKGEILHVYKCQWEQIFANNRKKHDNRKLPFTWQRLVSAIQNAAIFSDITPHGKKHILIKIAKASCSAKALTTTTVRSFPGIYDFILSATKQADAEPAAIMMIQRKNSAGTTKRNWNCLTQCLKDFTMSVEGQ